MSKELEALKRLYEHLDAEDLSGDNYYINDNASKDFDIIENALKRLDELDTWINQSNTTKIKALNNKLKALEVIKEKKVNLEYIKCCENYEQYKTVCSYWNEITQEEFDLLKETLE